MMSWILLSELCAIYRFYYKQPQTLQYTEYNNIPKIDGADQN